MSLTTATQTLEADAATVLLLGPLPGPAQVTLAPIAGDVALAAASGIDPSTGAADLFAMPVSGAPIALDLATGASLYAASAAAGSPASISYIVSPK